MPLLHKKERQSDNGNTFVDPGVKASKRTRMGRMAKSAWGLPEPFSLGGCRQTLWPASLPGAGTEAGPLAAGFVPYETINGSFMKASVRPELSGAYAGASVSLGWLLQAVWAEFVVTTLFLYLTTVSVQQARCWRCLHVQCY